MIHKYKMNGYNIVLDVNSGGIHVVDDIVYDMIDDFENSKQYIIDKYTKTYTSEEVEEAYDEIQQLKENGKLFTEDYSSTVLDKVNNRQPVVKALCLHIAHDCNLKCKYCFAEEGEYHGHKRSLMSSEVGKKALDLLVASSGNRVNLEVDFFGGEPLMNFSVVKEIVEYGRELEKTNNKKFRFTLTTNGVLLTDEIMEYAKENMSNAVLSIDGRKEVNDKVRFDFGGNGSYETILPKFQKMADDRGQENYYARGTFTRYNLDFSKDVLHLADKGFKQISIEPVVSSPDTDYCLREEDLPIIFDEYEKLAVEMIERRKKGQFFNFFHFMIDLTGGPCVTKRLVGCGAGTEYLAVTPEGDLYPCHQFVGLDGFLLGTVDTGVVAKDITDKFEACNVYAKEECKTCWNKFYCSGGCAANAYQTNGDILSPYEIGCELQKKRTECAIMLKVDEAVNKQYK